MENEKKDIADMQKEINNQAVKEMEIAKKCKEFLQENEAIFVGENYANFQILINKFYQNAFSTYLNS